MELLSNISELFYRFSNWFETSNGQMFLIIFAIIAVALMVSAIAYVAIPELRFRRQVNAIQQNIANLTSDN